MPTRLDAFEKICRRAHVVNESNRDSTNNHPFEIRNLHSSIPAKSRKLFDDGHYSEATFESLKFVDKYVQELSGAGTTGYSLMMQVFGGENPAIRLSDLSDQSKIDEQSGYKHMFAGIMSAIRNPKGHEYEINDDPDTCLDHLSCISLLLRRLEQAGQPRGGTISARQ